MGDVDSKTRYGSHMASHSRLQHMENMGVNARIKAVTTARFMHNKLLDAVEPHRSAPGEVLSQAVNSRAKLIQELRAIHELDNGRRNVASGGGAMMTNRDLLSDLDSANVDEASSFPAPGSLEDLAWAAGALKASEAARAKRRPPPTLTEPSALAAGSKDLAPLNAGALRLPTLQQPPQRSSSLCGNEGLAAPRPGSSSLCMPQRKFSMAGNVELAADRGTSQSQLQLPADTWGYADGSTERNNPSPPYGKAPAAANMGLTVSVTVEETVEEAVVQAPPEDATAAAVDQPYEEGGGSEPLPQVSAEALALQEGAGEAPGSAGGTPSGRSSQTSISPARNRGTPLRPSRASTFHLRHPVVAAQYELATRPRFVVGRKVDKGNGLFSSVKDEAPSSRPGSRDPFASGGGLRPLSPATGPMLRHSVSGAVMLGGSGSPLGSATSPGCVELTPVPPSGAPASMERSPRPERLVQLSGSLMRLPRVERFSSLGANSDAFARLVDGAPSSPKPCAPGSPVQAPGSPVAPSSQSGSLHGAEQGIYSVDKRAAHLFKAISGAGSERKSTGGSPLGVPGAESLSRSSSQQLDAALSPLGEPRTPKFTGAYAKAAATYSKVQAEF